MLPFKLDQVDRVEFYNRDELTTDLVCCEVTAGDRVLFSHEQDANSAQPMGEPASLRDFDRNWFDEVSQPAFAECRTVAFQR